MIKTFGLKSEYAPIKKLGEDYYKISWNYEEVKDMVYKESDEVDEDGKKVRIPTGEYVDTDYCTYTYETIHFEPTIEYIKNLITTYYNNQVDNKILSGFVWNEIPVWLSSENQFNYKAAYDLAVQTEGQSLPVKFKFGTTNEPVYYTFESIEDFTSFYTSAITYINTCLAEGWEKKDSIDWGEYNVLN